MKFENIYHFIQFHISIVSGNFLPVLLKFGSTCKLVIQILAAKLYGPGPSCSKHC